MNGSTLTAAQVAPEPSESSVIEFVKAVGLFAGSAKLSAKEIGDGNVNFVFRVFDTESARSVIVKQAVPYFKCAGRDYALGLGRARIEADALQIQHRLAPGLVPELHYRADGHGINIMEDLSHLETMRTGMLRLERYPRFAEHISTFLSRLVFFTSDHHLRSSDKRRLQQQFSNPELCKITEDLVFSDPYHDCERNRINPLLRPYLEREFWRRDNVLLAAAQMKQKFLVEGQSLVHGDLHTGSIFANRERTIVFDAEFAFVGPSSFDLGKLMGNLLINYMCWNGRSADSKQVAEYRTYLIDLIHEIQSGFESKLGALLESGTTDVMARVPGYREHYLRRLFVDQVGYCAVTMIRRMHGLARNLDVEGIEDLERRCAVQVQILELAAILLITRERLSNISEVTAMLQRSAQ